MVDFRRGITALAVLALFAGLASAQVGGTGQSQLTCNTNVTVTPQLRSEGFTESTGDIVISCTGGSLSNLPVGANIPLVNFTIFFNTGVTSRLFSTASSSIPNEALLLVDEPGSGLPGEGPARAQKLCTTPLTGCTATVGTSGLGTPMALAGDGTYSPNVYQGIAASSAASNNAITFFGVPVLPPTTTGQRVYRITNVRVNATQGQGGTAAGAFPVTASIAISGATSLGIQNSGPIVGYISNSLSASASGSTTLNQCSTQTRSTVNTITFSENFGTAFKTRVVAQSNTAYAGQTGTVPANPAVGNQATPGGIYNSESNFIFPLTSSTGGTAGLADFGTRLKATFNNIPSGARIFVSTVNVNNAAVRIAPPTPIGGSTGNLNAPGYIGFARLINGENTSDGAPGSPALGDTSTVFVPDSGDSVGNVPVAEVPIDPTSKSGTAVWEVLNTDPNTLESFKFGVYISYSANTATNSPLPGISTVNLSYAPVTTSTAASSTASIPRFVGDSATTPRNIFQVIICRTVLLYPYVLNQLGLDTGLAVANTSRDSFTGLKGTGMKDTTNSGNITQDQSGSCTLSFFPADPTSVAPANADTGIIKGGGTFAATLSTYAPGFQGYMFAVCNFQYAHGFAFISDIGIRNISMGYLAVVLDDPGTSSRFIRNTQTTENGGH